MSHYRHAFAFEMYVVESKFQKRISPSHGSHMISVKFVCALYLKKRLESKYYCGTSPFRLRKFPSYSIVYLDFSFVIKSLSCLTTDLLSDYSLFAAICCAQISNMEVIISLRIIK